MFTTLKYRRYVAVLATLAMVASVLVAAPAVAADPEADFPAMFDACLDAPSSGFEDVPASHANAGDIDCIAYYGITQGTSATTYSPSMAVTREQMALFLTRLAGVVGIPMVSDPADPGFTDVGDLSAESQTAIAQLADLGITQGTSDTTFSPGNNVRRDHMALFIQRLMNNMSPLADGNTKYGSLPSDVAKDTENVASPYTDLGGSTKSAYDAITQLYELGVVSGISATAYAPGADITRAAMAEFMAGLLDHSNARPAGLTIQTSKNSDFGEISDAVVMVSYRSDKFMPMAEVSVDIFNSEAPDGGLGENGKCKATDGPTATVGGTACEQDDNDAQTDEMGNIFTTGTATEGATNVYTAWTGDSGDEFDADDIDAVSVSITAKQDVTALHVTSTISDNADDSDYDSDVVAGNDENTALEDSDSDADEPRVDLDVTGSVTFTVQLRDTNGASVAKPDQSVMVTVMMTGNTTSTNTYTVKTDADGMASYTVDAPSDNDSDNRRLDVVTFANDSATDDVMRKILWLEDDPALTSTVASVSTPYAVISGAGTTSTAKIAASVMLYDQYGNVHKAAGQQVTFTVPTGGDPVTRSAASGRASYTGTATAPTAGTDLEWSATVTVPDGDDADELRDAGPTVTTTEAGVMPVNNAADGTARGLTVTDLYDKQDKFHVGGVLYGYDSDDTFLNAGKRITMDKFEEMLGKGIEVTTAATVDVTLYDDNGSSIFNVTAAAS